jgi:hypothetical protein
LTSVLGDFKTEIALHLNFRVTDQCLIELARSSAYFDDPQVFRKVGVRAKQINLLSEVPSVGGRITVIVHVLLSMKITSRVYLFKWSCALFNKLKCPAFTTLPHLVVKILA